MMKELKDFPDEEFDMMVAEMLGYGLYSINGGRLVSTVKFALADTMDPDGLYAEGHTIAEVLAALDDELESHLVPAITNYAEVEA